MLPVLTLSHATLAAAHRGLRWWHAGVLVQHDAESIIAAAIACSPVVQIYLTSQSVTGSEQRHLAGTPCQSAQSNGDLRRRMRGTSVGATCDQSAALYGVAVAPPTSAMCSLA